MTIIPIWDASKTGKVKFSSGLRPNMKVNLTFPGTREFVPDRDNSSFSRFICSWYNKKYVLRGDTRGKSGGIDV